MRTPQEIIAQSKTIAVVGMSDDPSRESYNIGKYLKDHGFTVIPVNPTLKTVLGETCYPTLLEVPVPVDLVDVFRRPEFTPAIAKDAVAIKAKAFWLQVGIVNEEAARIARDSGLDVVMDHCTMVAHRRAASQKG